MTVATVLLPPPAAGALLDADRGRNAGDQVHVRPRHLLHELPGVDVHRIQETPLPFRKEEVKGQRAFARAADSGDDHKLVARNDQGEVLQVVLPRAVDGDGARSARIGSRASNMDRRLHWIVERAFRSLARLTASVVAC